MNFLKRALYSILYSWKRTLSYFLIFLILCTLILVSLDIRSACEDSIDQLKGSIASDIVLTDTSGAGRFFVSDRNILPLEKIGEIGALSGVKGTAYSVVLEGYAKDFASQIPEEVLQEYPDNPTIRIYGETESETADRFRAEDVTLLDGRHLTAEDKGTALIHMAIAQSNQISLNDEITIQSWTNQRVASFRVVGIFAGTSNDDLTDGVTALPENAVFIPAEDAVSLLGARKAAKAVFTLRDPDTAPEIIAQAQEILGDSKPLFTVEDGEYRRLAAPLVQLTGIMTVMMWASILLGAVVLAFTCFLFLRSRDREVGILLAMGERRVNILTQMIVEFLLPMLVAAIASLFIGQAMPRQPWTTIMRPGSITTLKDAQPDTITVSSTIRAISDTGRKSAIFSPTIGFSRRGGILSRPDRSGPYRGTQLRFYYWPFPPGSTINIPPHSGGYFSFGQSPNNTGGA